MASDVQLDTPYNGWVQVAADIVRSTATDFMLDSAARRGGAGGPHRRALVHGGGDTLIVNFNEDYSGGVVVNDARVNLHTVRQGAGAPQLPRAGQLGDLFVVSNVQQLGGRPIGESVTLWLCLGHPAGNVMLPDASVLWAPITLGEAVRGTA